MNHGTTSRFAAVVCIGLITNPRIFAQHHSPPVGNHECPAPPALNAPPPPATDGAIVQLALLLDTSNSMDGLIDQARSQLWAVVNDLARLRHKCQPVQLQVALFQYGNDGLDPMRGFVQLRVPFTSDLDIVSEQLFSLRTNGGSEFCGTVIAAAADSLNWIPPRAPGCCPPVMRLMVIAGNEPFTQGTVPYTSSTPSATNKGITVHTVFCGPREEGARTCWSEGARLGEGRYFSIDQQCQRIEIETPFDRRISELNSKLNTTYIPYGAFGRESHMRQLAQDRLNSGSRYNENVRAASKAGALYQNDAWDLVDAAGAKDFRIADVDRATLPPEMQGLTPEQLAAAIEAKAAERRAVQEEMRRLLAEREQFLQRQQGPRITPDDLGSALILALRDSAAARGLTQEGDAP